MTEKRRSEVPYTSLGFKPAPRSAASESLGLDELPLESYHQRVTRAYAGLLNALEQAGVTAEMIDTGGSVKAIWISGTHDGQGAHRNFTSPHAGLALTAGGELTEDRNPSEAWEAGLYDAAGEQVGSFWLTLVDDPSNDRALAEDMRKIAELIR